MTRSIIMFALFAVGFFALLYVGACTLLYFMQDSFIFHPSANDAALVKDWQQQHVEIVGAESTIDGWWAVNPRSKRTAVVLYFGGNAEDVLYAASAAKQLDAPRMLVTNYRGYGARAGKPSQKALFEDALAIYDYAVNQVHVSAEDIVVMGRSLGSGVATYVAAHRPIRSVVLVTPYDNFVSLAKDQFPWIPANWLLRNKFPSDELAREIHKPLLIVAGSNDQVIPPIHARRLYAAWAGPKKIVLLQGADHNTIDGHPDYYATINAFLTL